MKMDDNWQLGMETKIPFDPLMDSLIILTKHYDHPFSAHVLSAGLPLVNNRLTPELFSRAAERADLSAKVIKTPIKNINKKQLPVILLLKNQQACIVTEISDDGIVSTIEPESGAGIDTTTLDELNENYIGHAIYVRPIYRFDARTEETGKPQPKHWFWSVVIRGWPIYSEVLVASLLINIFAIASPLFIMNVYDRVVPNAAIETLWVLAIGVLIVFGFDFLMRNLRSYFIDAAGKKVDIRLSRRIFEQLLGLKMDVRPRSVGTTANMVQAFESFRDFITSATISVLVDLPFVVLFLLVIWMLAGPVVLVPLVTIPLVIIVGLLLQRPLKKIVKETFRHSAEKQAILLESLSNTETIKCQRAEGLMQRRWEATVTRSATLGKKLRVYSNLIINFSIFMSFMSSVGVVIVGVYVISAGDMTVGALIASTILTGRAMAPIGQVAGLMTRYQQAVASIGTLDVIMNLPTERPANKEFLHRPELKGNLEFRGVTFSYPQQPIVAMDDVSFNIKSGQKVGIIGRTGSGKTTLEKLILKLYQPQSGSILIDGTEIQQIDPAELRHYIGYVPQDLSLFHGTIKDNIVIGAPHADDSTILHAATLAGVDGFVKQHPDGFDRLVGEQGQELSGGQRQAIAIARALLLDPPILVFDEPCSGMDDSTTMQFIQRLKTQLQHKTLILITHQAQMLALVDQLIVLDNGGVLIKGSKEKVLQELKEHKIKTHTMKVKRTEN